MGCMIDVIGRIGVIDMNCKIDEKHVTNESKRFLHRHAAAVVGIVIVDNSAAFDIAQRSREQIHEDSAVDFVEFHRTDSAAAQFPKQEPTDENICFDCSAD